ncbi:hypothetical protein CEXT_122391 [Caerostris extrusa]|uniref:C2H2-type domain-containing protein n=1 Tax=Caerostris extrusa TaxID=172846 RepID=A0AAV4YDG8_CAEEX|nr:hypothetical protein CEXT_122391 [Caerostris extrusa]
MPPSPAPKLFRARVNREFCNERLIHSFKWLVWLSVESSWVMTASSRVNEVVLFLEILLLVQFDSSVTPHPLCLISVVLLPATWRRANELLKQTRCNCLKCSVAYRYESKVFHVSAYVHPYASACPYSMPSILMLGYHEDAQMRLPVNKQDPRDAWNANGAESDTC